MKKSRELKELEELAHQRKLSKYPNLPLHCVPKTTYSDHDTNSLTKAVIDCFNLHSFFATRIDSKGTFNPTLQRFIPSMQKRGLPDCFAQRAGFPPIWVEVKCAATKDRLKSHQAKVIEELRKSGAIVYIAQDFESFYQWFKNELLIKQTAE